jgi:hypothetical protein
MKGSMMNTLKRILALGINGTLLVLTACTKLDENPTNGATDPAAVVFSGYGMDLSQVLGKYDLAGIQGYVNFATTNDDKYSTINGDTATIINGIANSSSAKFIDGSGRLLSATSVVVNAMQLFRYADSYYQVSTDKPIDIYLGNGVNKYVVEAGADIPEIKGSVSFTSHKRNDSRQRQFLANHMDGRRAGNVGGGQAQIAIHRCYTAGLLCRYDERRPV